MNWQELAKEEQSSRQQEERNAQEGVGRHLAIHGLFGLGWVRDASLAGSLSK